MRIYLIKFLFLVFVLLIGRPEASYALTEKERDHLRSLPAWFPSSACRADRVFRKCFVWSEDECVGVSQAVAQSCLNMHKDFFMKDQASSLEDWQNRLTVCTQKDIRARMQGRVISSLDCKNKGVP